jgi:riboflavin kinase
MQTIVLHGKVFSGQKGGTKFIKLPWVERQIIEKLGFTPYPGTLNLKLTKESIEIKKQLLKAKAIEILPVKGFCCGLCFKARIMDKIDGAIVLPQVPTYPEDVVEIIAPASLRETLKLKEGDEVQLKIYLPA